MFWQGTASTALHCLPWLVLMALRAQQNAGTELMGTPVWHLGLLWFSKENHVLCSRVISGTFLSSQHTHLSRCQPSSLAPPVV